MTLEQANLKYKDVARIERNENGLYYVYDADGYLHEALNYDLEDAIEACKWLDNAEPAERQI